MRNRNGYLQLAVLVVIAGSFIAVLLRERDAAASRTLRGEEEVEITSFLEQLGRTNPDFQNVFTVLNPRQPLTIQGTLRTQAEIDTVRKHVESKFSLDERQIDRMVRIHLESAGR